MEMNFCRRCGEKLEKKGVGFFKCPTGHSHYTNASPTAGVFFVTDNTQVILSRRAIEPGKGKLDAFGGFIDENESAEDSIKRELLEETGLTDQDYEPLAIFCTAPSYYHFEGEGRPVLSTFFWSRLKPHAKPKPQDDVAEIVTLPLANINLDLFHADDVKAGIKKLQVLMGVL